MDTNRKHDRIQLQIISTCQTLGIAAKQEYRGKGWRADVYIQNGESPIAFEIQLSPQTLSKTLQRQEKYSNEGILGCWLFEKPISKLTNERPDLPVFYVEETGDSNLIVNLGNRRRIDLRTFLENFISRKIQFKEITRTNKRQSVKLVFYKMKCWKCSKQNDLYFVDTPFYSSCNSIIKSEEALWESNSVEYFPEIIDLASKFVELNPNFDLKLSSIKHRYSNTVKESYLSFGCYNCDSLFGDFYVMNAKLDARYDLTNLSYQAEIELHQDIELNVPHWCFPINGQFCGEH